MSEHQNKGADGSDQRASVSQQYRNEYETPTVDIHSLALITQGGTGAGDSGNGPGPDFNP